MKSAENKTESRWHAILQMPEDAILRGVHIECLGNVRNERFKSKFSVLPTSMSVTTGGSVSQLYHAGEAKFQVKGGQSSYGRNKGSVTAISEVTTSQILTSRILGLTLTLSTNNMASSAVPGGHFSTMTG